LKKKKKLGPKWHFFYEKVSFSQKLKEFLWERLTKFVSILF